LRERLTKLVVDGLRSEAKDVIVWDRDLKGFGVKITPSSKKVYFAYYRTTSGKQRKPTIGLHGKVTTEEARQIARKWIAAAISGHDISADRQEARAAPLIRDLAQRYLDDYAACFKKPSSCKSDKSNLNNHVLPLLGTKIVSEVTRADIENVKIAIREGRTAARRKAKFRGRSITTGGPGVANRAVALLSKMMGCAVDWGMRPDNPAFRIKKYPEYRKDRFLDTDEIRRLIQALDQVEVQDLESLDIIAWVRLLLFTGLRLGEVRDLHWNDVDLARGTLKLRDSKTGARAVPLNDQAISVLRRHRATRVDQFVIQSATAGGRPSLGKPWARIRKLAGIDDTANIHCLRHTFASWAVMGGLSLAQTGALLGHKSTQTTLRYADHLTEAVRGYSQQTANMIAGEQIGSRWPRLSCSMAPSDGWGRQLKETK
jgi:integrase